MEVMKGIAMTEHGLMWITTGTEDLHPRTRKLSFNDDNGIFNPSLINSFFDTVSKYMDLLYEKYNDTDRLEIIADVDRVFYFCMDATFESNNGE